MLYNTLLAIYIVYQYFCAAFITSRRWIKVITLLYCVTLAYGMIKLLVVRSIWYLYLALPSPLYFGSHISEILIITLFAFSPQRPNIWGRHLPPSSPSKQRTIPATRKKINSNPAETRTWAHLNTPSQFP